MVTLFPGLPGVTCVILVPTEHKDRNEMVSVQPNSRCHAKKPLKRRKILYIRGFGFITVSSSCIFIFILCFQVVAHPTIHE